MFTDHTKTGQAYRILVGEDSEENHIYDLISFWTAASDVEFSSGGNLEEVGGTFYYTEGVLPVGETQIEISSDKITKDGLLDIYVEDEFCHVTPRTVSRPVENKVILTFPPQTKEMRIRVVCKNYYDAHSIDHNANNNNNNNDNNAGG